MPPKSMPPKNMPSKNKENHVKPLVAKRAAVAQKTVAKKDPQEDILIPDKLYFRIGEVSRLCRLPAYVLRFWETEFPQLHPVKSSTGQRVYGRRDVAERVR